jgi:cardiolipin synthase C
MALRRSPLRAILTLAVAALLAACGTLPPKLGQTASEALPPSTDSPLVQVARQSTATPSQTGFRLMPQAYYSLDVRIELVRRARHSLDVQ